MKNRQQSMELRHSKVFIITFCLILVLGVGAIDARQSEKRRKDKSTTSERPQTTNICDISDRDSKVHCYCEETQAYRNVSKAECWVFNGGLAIDDPIWEAFKSQNRLQELSFNVRADGALLFVPTRALRFMQRLKKLIIKYGNIDEIYSFAFANLTSLREIVLSRNKIVALEANAFAHLPNMTSLELDENRIAEIGKNSFVDLPSLTKLYLTNNNISIIQDGGFKHLVQLLELELDKNSIALLNRATFDGLANLKRLDLKTNRLKMLNDFTFAELWNLQELLLDANELKVISERAFDGLSQLKTLSLSDNRLTVLTSGLFEGVRGLTHLDLRQNRLQTLTIDDIRPILDNLRLVSSLLLLDDNNFSCDCRLTWVHALRNDTKNEKTKGSLEQISCTLESSTHDDFLDNSVERAKQNKAFGHAQDNRLHEKSKHKVLSQKSTIEYLDTPDTFKEGLDDEAYDEPHKDVSNHLTKAHNDTAVAKNRNKKHLFQIPIETLPCSEELKDSTEAPLSRPSRGEVKDFRGLSPGNSLQATAKVILQSGIFSWLYCYVILSQ